MDRMTNNKRLLERDIYFIQGAVKDTNGTQEPRGVGDSMTINFRAPIEEQSPQSASNLINYSLENFQEDLDLLRQHKFEEYALRQCYKIANFMQQTRSIEILQMQAEFLRDENDNVWLSNAKKIEYRWCMIK